MSSIDGSGNSTSGVELVSGAGAWSTLSDRSSKENIEVVDPGEVLKKVSKLPISIWNWKAQEPSIRHMGPMAQDMHAAFGLGEDERRISTVDSDGIALAAIQGLYEENQQIEARIAEMEARIMQVMGDRTCQ